MGSAIASVRRILVVVALCGTTRHWIEVRNPCAGPSQAATAQDSSVPVQLTDEELFSRLHERHDWQQSHLSEFSVVRTYTVRNDKGVVVAQEVVTMKYIPPGTKTFTVVSAKGSGFVRTHVFQPLMAREAARTRNQNDSDALITPENYKFEITGKEHVGSYECIVVHAIPRHKKSDLFEGEIWIDSRDFAIVKIKGHLAKSPSFWVKRVEFERQYEKISGFFVLLRETAAANIRIYGRRTLTVDHQEYAFSEIHAAERARNRFRSEVRPVLTWDLSGERAERPVRGSSADASVQHDLTVTGPFAATAPLTFGFSDQRKTHANCLEHESSSGRAIC